MKKNWLMIFVALLSVGFVSCSITDGKSYAYYMSINGKAEGEIGSWQKYFGMSVRGVIDIE